VEYGKHVTTLTANPEAVMVLSQGMVALHLALGYVYSYMKGVAYENYSVAPEEVVHYGSWRAGLFVCFRLKG